MTPVSMLNADFLNQAVDMNVGDLSNSSSRLKPIICDGNVTNQSFFKKYETVEAKPWLREDGIYLLFNYVHLLKKHNQLMDHCENSSTAV